MQLTQLTQPTRLLLHTTQGLARLRQRHGFLLAVDEAHATLVCGERGGGAAEMLGVCDSIDLHVGTLSKAFGALGGFVACSSAFKRYLSNKGRSVVYSTALPLPVVAAALAAIEARAACWGVLLRLLRLRLLLA